MRREVIGFQYDYPPVEIGIKKAIRKCVIGLPYGLTVGLAIGIKKAHANSSELLTWALCLAIRDMEFVNLAGGDQSSRFSS